VRYWLVMPAAGAGRRFGTSLPKQYATLNGRTVLEWALSPFVSDPRCAGIAVAIATDDTRWVRVSEKLPPVTVTPGGAERSESVRNALSAIARRAAPKDWVLVHDAARPCLPNEDRDRLITTLQDEAVGGLLALPMGDTVKQSGAEQAVEKTVDRTGLWRAQTPQMFRFSRLVDALDQALAGRRFASDEAQAMEWVGEHPKLVEGSPHNIKITSSHDLLLAEAILKGRTA
jgi:2-C-methyl-D-erythritol 4-phosphate cytidylyltransferase